ncbi:uncharacterized protein CCOS01_15326, partial [Colletotrichum costaricense]
ACEHCGDRDPAQLLVAFFCIRRSPLATQLPLLCHASESRPRSQTTPAHTCQKTHQLIPYAVCYSTYPPRHLQPDISLGPPFCPGGRGLSSQPGPLLVLSWLLLRIVSEFPRPSLCRPQFSTSSGHPANTLLNRGIHPRRLLIRSANSPRSPVFLNSFRRHVDSAQPRSSSIGNDLHALPTPALSVNTRQSSRTQSASCQGPVYGLMSAHVGLLCTFFETTDRGSLGLFSGQSLSSTHPPHTTNHFVVKPMRRGGHRQPPGTDIAAAWRISLSCTAIDLIL